MNRRMKTITLLAGVVLMGLGVGSAAGQGVWVTGNNGYCAPAPVPVVAPGPVGYPGPGYGVPPLAASAPIGYGYGYGAPGVPYNPYYPQYFPNVMYIGGPGSCGPNFGYFPRFSTPNVIYFGELQGYRQGYQFRYCR